MWAAHVLHGNPDLGGIATLIFRLYGMGFTTGESLHLPSLDLPLLIVSGISDAAITRLFLSALLVARLFSNLFFVKKKKG